MNRWPSGWWVAPACFICACIWGGIAYVIFGGE